MLIAYAPQRKYPVGSLPHDHGEPQKKNYIAGHTDCFRTLPVLHNTMSSINKLVVRYLCACRNNTGPSLRS